MAHPESAKPAAGPTTEPELESFLNGLDSGDLLLFDNKAKSAAFLKLVQATHFDHVGIIVKDTFTQRLLVLEAVVPEVCLFDLRKRIETAKVNQLVVRRLQGVERDAEFRQKLQLFTKETVGKPYEQRRRELVKACFPGCSNEIGDESSLFCSELVAAAYQALGLLPPTPVASNYLPSDFASTKKDRLPLVKGVALSERISVVGARKAACW